MTSRRAFGEALRGHREQRGISLETISGITKISASLLAALERGDCSRWPAGIYSRAYIRDYARAIGLDRDEVAARFNECFAETAFPDGAPERPETVPSVQPPSTPLRLMLEESLQDRRRRLARHAVVLALDLFLTIVLAAALSIATNAGFWMTLAVVSVCCQAVGVLRRGSSTSDLLVRASGGSQARRIDSGAAESPLAEAA